MYTQPLEQSYGVLLKHRSLAFSGDAVPLDSGRPADARIPGTRNSVKEEPGIDEAVAGSQEDDDPEIDAKPHVQVEYDSMRMVDRELVLVIEPSVAVIEANPSLFVVEDDGTREQRQLRNEPIGSRAWAPAPPSSSRVRSETPLFRGMTPN